MAKITFKSKKRTVFYVDGSLAYECLDIPELKRSPCDMHAFRTHKKYGSYANSDLFPGMLKRIRADVFRGKNLVYLHDIPPGVTVDASGFLCVVSFEV